MIVITSGMDEPRPWIQTLRPCSSKQSVYSPALLIKQLWCDVEVSWSLREVRRKALAETKFLVTEAGMVVNLSMS